MNEREHPLARHRRVKAEHQQVGWAMVAARIAVPRLPCIVTLTRVAPSRGLDDDNLRGALKAVRDYVAQWLGVDDADPRVQWRYGQRNGGWGVVIELG